jgi:hypothetical protein
MPELNMQAVDPMKGVVPVLSAGGGVAAPAEPKPRPKTMIGILRDGISDDLRSIAQGVARGERIDTRYAAMAVGAALGVAYLSIRALSALGVKGPLPAAAAGVGAALLLDYAAVKAEDNAAAQEWLNRMESRSADPGADGTNKDGGS